MILGSAGQTQGRWFTFAGKKARLCANYPTTEQWETHMRAVGELNHGTPKPLDGPPKSDLSAFYRVSRETAAPCLTGVEFETDALEGWTGANWNQSLMECGPLQHIITDLAGFLFREAAAFCDDGSGEAA
jgi:hypothetical protein